MVKPRQQRSYSSIVSGLMTALAATVMACTFVACEFGSPDALDTPVEINEALNKAPLRSLEAADRWTVYEVPGKLSVQHGFGCASQDHAATKEYLGFRIQDSASVPLAFADAGTILLNGWDVQYTNGDHHVTGLGTVIFNITESHTVDEFALHWEAGGVLSDKNGDDDYKWCYRYTLVFWNQGAFDAVVPPQDDVATTFVESGTALLDLPGQFPTPPYPGPHAVVPRGIGLSYWDADHEVLQVGFDLGPDTPDIVGNELTWTSQTVLKDEDSDDAHVGVEFVTILSGKSIEMWQPPTVLHLIGGSSVKESNELKLQPYEPECNAGNGQEEHLEHYMVEGVPFDYAIPVLTGWNMEYACADHHVERIGVYIVEFDYVQDPKTGTGTMFYTIFSTMRDDSNNGHYDPKYQVSILGLNAQDGGSEQ